MNDLNDANQTHSNSGQAASGYCQQCGKALSQDAVRKVGASVFCEPCLAARLGHAAGPAQGHGPGAAAGQAGPPPAGWGPVRVGGTWRGGAWTTENLNAPGPNPGLAGLLGLIPGVGAFYNEQYAKGIVHLVIFAVLVSMADHVSDIFGLFCFGWICYMAIEAHHTARARRDGAPLPNPFGLNDVGERFGFHKNWANGQSVTDAINDAAAAARAHTTYTTPYGSSPPPAQPAAWQPAPQPWGAPAEAATAAPPVQEPANHAAYTEPFIDQTYAQAYRAAGTGRYPGGQDYPQGGAAPGGSYTTSQGSMPYTPIPPFAPMPAMDPLVYPTAGNRFPAGAVILIGLGTIFLLATTGIFNEFNFRPEAILGTALLGIAAWIFLAKMTSGGGSISNDHSSMYSIRLMQALMSMLWLALLGALFLFDGLNLLRWQHSWPLFIILPGVLALMRRSCDQAIASTFVGPMAPGSGATAGKTEPTQGAL